MNIQDWFPLGLTGLISLLSKGLSWVFSSTTVWKHQILWHSAFFMIQLSHPYMTTGKTIAWTRWTFVGRVISLLFNMLFRLVIAFLYIKLFSSIITNPHLKELFRGWSSKEYTCQCRGRKRWGFDPWVGKIPWRRKWQPAPVFLLGKSHGQGNLVGYSPQDGKE